MKPTILSPHPHLEQKFIRILDQHRKILKIYQSTKRMRIISPLLQAERTTRSSRMMYRITKETVMDSHTSFFFALIVY